MDAVGARVPYAGRPGVSPAVAALVALGRLRAHDRVLDVGCGTGTDAITLARWGFRDVVGVDPDARAIGVARARATRLGLDVAFEALAAEDLLARFGPRRFDVVLHTLVANNLRGDAGEHARNVAGVLRRGGLLVLHERIRRDDEAAAPGELRPDAAFERHFDLGDGVTTHLAEFPDGRGGTHARVVLWLGTPRRRTRSG